MLRLFVIAAMVALAPAAYAADAQQMDENKKVVLQLYEAAINQKDFEVASKFLGPRYIQHNPRAADGPEGLKAFLAFLREKLPDYHSEIKRVCRRRLCDPPRPQCADAEAAVATPSSTSSVWKMARWSSTGMYGRKSRKQAANSNTMF